MGITSLVTLHGIGFEQPPQQDVAGYADDLHTNLYNCLGKSILSDDPQRQAHQTGDSVPIYVQSCWPPGSHSSETGMARLGSWSGQELRKIDASEALLTTGDSSLAHVALVYSHLEGQTPQIGASLITGAMVAVSVAQYAHIVGLVQMIFADGMAMIPHRKTNQDDDEIPTSLRVRNDAGFVPVKHHQGNTLTGLLAILRQLENDVAAYVCHNEMRERVRSFVHDAILRLACRDDVSSIIINAHSNGTVVALDVIRQLPPFAAAKVKGFITAGSPLRKYIDLFRWGQQIESVNPINQWINFWDEKDPVGDPLAPPVTWRKGDKVELLYDPVLFRYIDPITGNETNLPVEDRKVDNMKNSSPGGLQAHNYWDNIPEFVQPLCDIIKKEVVANQAPVAAPVGLGIGD